MPTPQISTFEQLKNFINENLPDNISGVIDPLDIRTSLLRLIDTQELNNAILYANFSPEQTEVWNSLIDKLEQIQIGNNLGLIKTTDTPPATGKYRGDVATAGTYTNFKNSEGVALAFTQPEIDENFCSIYVSDNICTKVNTEKRLPVVENITQSQTTFAEEILVFGKNRFNKLTVTPNKYVNPSTGELLDNNSYFASDYINVTDLQGKDVVLSYLFHISFYTKKDATGYISGREYGPANIEVPNSAKYCRFSIADSFPLDIFQFEAGSIATFYENYTFPISKTYIPNLELGFDNLPMIAVPSVIYWLVGKQMNIYFESSIFGKIGQKARDFYCSVLSTKGKFLEKKYRVSPTDNFTFKIKAEKDEKSISKTVNVEAVPTTNGNGITRKILTIGDSTVNAAYTTYKMKQFFDSDVMNIDFIGTLVGNTVHHEGRSGWSFFTYGTNYSGNPFWNAGTSKFDLSYYLTSTSQTLGANDWVHIQLGINDLFQSALLDETFDVAAKIEQMKVFLTAMITSIHEHNSNIRIGIAITIPPAISQDSTGNGLNSSAYSLEYYVKKGLVKWWEYLLAMYDNETMRNSKIYLVPVNCTIDRENNFPTEIQNIDEINSNQISVQNNDVHPDLAGYEQMSIPYISIVKKFA